MTTHDRDKIIAADKEAGCIQGELAIENITQLTALYATAFEAGRVAEREECAKVCDTDWNGDADTYAYSEAANECAEAIRARSTK